MSKIITSACPFCEPGDIIFSNDLAYARFDKYPVNEGHILIIPYRHIKDFFETTEKENIALIDLINKGKALLEEEHKPDGYNIGINVGEAAGQTVMHLHIHLIPRYKGDVPDPTGGIRGVIPRKQKY